MQPLSAALRLLQRQAELEIAMRIPGGIRVTEERQLYQFQAHLAQFRAATRAMVEASRHLPRP